MANAVPLVALVGPTGSGKSGYAIELVRELAGRGLSAEIISADAMQLYRGMDIGTAKVTPDEAGEVVHHLLDIWEPTEEASVQDYQVRARAAIEGCVARGVMPVLVGGSGLYVSSVIYPFEFPGTDADIRGRLEAERERFGVERLANRLVALDPEARESVDLNNPRRVIRALEIIELTGKSQAPGLEARARVWHEPSLVVGVDWPRDALVERINQRVSQMWSRGLVVEVRALHKAGVLGKTAAQAIGYREVVDFLEGTVTEAEAMELVAQHTRRYARKQMSWFRRDPLVRWIDAHKDPVVETLLQRIKALWPQGFSQAN